MHRVSLIPREDAIDELGKSRGPVEVVRVCDEDDLPAPLPAEEPERSRTDRLEAEGLALSFDQVAGHDLGVADREDGDEWHLGLAERHLHGVPVESDEA